MKKIYLLLGIAAVTAIAIFKGEDIYMLFKNGISGSKLRPEIMDKFPVIEAVFNRYGIHAIITSTFDSKHMTTSYHYLNLAVDLRLPSRINELISDSAVTRDLKAILGPAYDVVLESDHIHLEYDAKRANPALYAELISETKTA